MFVWRGTLNYHLAGLLDSIDTLYGKYNAFQQENENFRRFNYPSKDKVYKEFLLYEIGRNINKYHRFLHEEIKKYEREKRPKDSLDRAVE